MEKEIRFYKQLKLIKDKWVVTGMDSLVEDVDMIWSECEDEYKMLRKVLNTPKQRLAFKHVINELIRGTLHSMLVMVDGGDSLADSFQIDLVDRKTRKPIKQAGAYHENFYGYLCDVDDL